MRPLPSQGAPAGTAAAAPPAPSEPLLDAVFTDSFLRCFLLGLGSGVLCEGGHVAYELLGLQALSAEGLAHALNSYADQLAPMFVWDHVAAL